MSPLQLYPPPPTWRSASHQIRIGRITQIESKATLHIACEAAWPSMPVAANTTLAGCAGPDGKFLDGGASGNDNVAERIDLAPVRWGSSATLPPCRLRLPWTDIGAAVSSLCLCFQYDVKGEPMDEGRCVCCRHCILAIHSHSPCHPPAPPVLLLRSIAPAACEQIVTAADWPRSTSSSKRRASRFTKSATASSRASRSPERSTRQQVRLFIGNPSSLLSLRLCSRCPVLPPYSPPFSIPKMQAPLRVPALQSCFPGVRHLTRASMHRGS